MQSADSGLISIGLEVERLASKYFRGDKPRMGHGTLSQVPMVVTSAFSA